MTNIFGKVWKALQTAEDHSGMELSFADVGLDEAEAIHAVVWQGLKSVLREFELSRDLKADTFEFLVKLRSLALQDPEILIKSRENFDYDAGRKSLTIKFPAECVHPIKRALERIFDHMFGDVYRRTGATDLGQGRPEQVVLWGADDKATAVRLCTLIKTLIKAHGYDPDNSAFTMLEK